MSDASGREKESGAVCRDGPRPTVGPCPASHPRLPTPSPPLSSAGVLPTLVLGIGNILLSDEGVGVRVIEAMAGLDVPPGVELVDGGTSGADLVDLIADRRKLIVVDAMDAGAEPGTVFRLGPDDLAPDEGEPISLHQLGLVESLLIARCLKCPPQEVVIFGVQPKAIRPGLELTSELAAVVPQVIRAVLEELGTPGPYP